MTAAAIAQGSGQFHSVVHFIQLDSSSPELREPRTLAQSARLINTALTFTVLSALLVCVSIGGLFLDAYRERSLTTLVAPIFSVSLAAWIIGLGLFLREIDVAAATLRIGSP